MGIEGERIRPYVDIVDRYRGERRRVEPGRYRWLARIVVLVILIALCGAGAVLPSAVAPVDLRNRPGPVPEETGPASP